MNNRVLFVFVPIALALNLWVGDRVPVGAVCPILESPSAASAFAGAADPVCAERCLLGLAGRQPG